MFFKTRNFFFILTLSLACSCVFASTPKSSTPREKAIDTKQDLISEVGITIKDIRDLEANLHNIRSVGSSASPEQITWLREVKSSNMILLQRLEDWINAEVAVMNPAYRDSYVCQATRVSLSNVDKALKDTLQSAGAGVEHLSLVALLDDQKLEEALRFDIGAVNLLNQCLYP